MKKSSRPSKASNSAKSKTGQSRAQSPRAMDMPSLEFYTTAQESFYKSIKKNTVSFAIGPAGTGKSHVALWAGLDSLVSGKVKRLVLTRPVVEAGEKLGFLPGTLKDKIDPYLRPLYDIVEEIVGKEVLDMWVAQGIIEVSPLAFMRGRTFKNAFVILDEAQNATYDQLVMLLTRLGAGSKMVIDGDPHQTDLRGEGSALSEAAFKLSHVSDISVTCFERSDSVRHPLIEKMLDALEGS